MLPFMSLPGRLAVLLVVSILVHGFLFQSNFWISMTHSAATESSSFSARPVNVSVYVEALCIDSKRYMNEQLVPAFAQLGSTVMEIQVVVFGNARINTTAQTVACQHGAAECDANTYAQCATHLYPYVERYLPYLGCLFNALPMGHCEEPFDPAVYASCARHAAVDATGLEQCHGNAATAWQLQQNAADKTPADHTYVPWIEINGSHIDEEAASLLDQVCRVYTESGGSHSACQEVVSVQVL